MLALLSNFYLAGTVNVIQPENLSPPAIITASQPTTSAKNPREELPAKLKLITARINLGKQNVIKSVLVRGKADGFQAREFDQWLLPYDTIIQALQFETKKLPDGQLELRSPEFVTRIDAKKIRHDPELGLVFSIQDLRTIFKITAEFNFPDNAIVLNLPWLDNSYRQNNLGKNPVDIETETSIKAPIFSLTNIEQQTNINQTSRKLGARSQRELSVIGTTLGGSWYIRARQQDVLKSNTWYLLNAQFALQKDGTDYFIGSHIPFWNISNNNDYWGFSTIQRQGFKPIESVGGEPNLRQRLQPAQMTRTIAGKAEPGTMVKLVQGVNDNVIAEILVDSSGIYRFEDVKINPRSYPSNYRLLLYPQGGLIQEPEVRNVNIFAVPGQIPVGTSALIASGGWNRKTNASQPNFWGEFNDFQGGILQRWGITEDLTVGIGGIYNKKLRGLGEIFYQPANFPLAVAVSASSPDEKGNWNFDADVRLAPAKNINANFRIDRLSQRFDLNLNLIKGLTLFGNIDSKNGAAAGLQILSSGKDNYTSARVTLDSQNRWRWNLLQRFGQLQFDQKGNEIGTSSELSYNFSARQFGDNGQFLVLGYESRNLAGKSNELINFSWRYRSKERTRDGRNLWETQLGYAMGSQGSGLIAVFQTTAIPGISLQARYQGVSLTSSEPSFSIQLVSNFNFQQGILPAERPSDRLRSQGGLMLQPFFDHNHNGKRDDNEKFYTNKPNLQFFLNNEPLKSTEMIIYRDHMLVPLQPGTYRLDLDSIGFLPDWQAMVDTYTVDVTAGAYTPVLIPLIRR